MRVLIASVDVFTVARIKLTLAKEKIMHDTTDLGEDGLHLAKLYDYDIVLYDVTRSEIDGYKMLQRLRNAQVDTPILILSGLGELDQRVKFLRFGADDVLTDPFDGGELLARIFAQPRQGSHVNRTPQAGRADPPIGTPRVCGLPRMWVSRPHAPASSEGRARLRSRGVLRALEAAS